MPFLAVMGLGPSEILLLVLIVVLVFGASRLPKIGSGLGQALRNFRKSIKGDEEDEKKEEKDDLPPK